MAYEDKKLLAIVNGQGYLLQQAVEQVIKNTAKDSYHGWQVVSTEHYWQHSVSGRTGYIDLIIEQDVGFLGVVECKRYAEETPWIFLCPHGKDTSTNSSSLHWVYSAPQTEASNGWSTASHSPFGYQAKFCVVNGQSKDKPMLEKTASELLYSTEALANQYLSWPKKQNGAVVFLPIIVTTAQLYVCRYDQKEVEPTSGTLDLTKVAFESVPYIRFHKVFTDSSVDLSFVERFYQIEERQRQTVVVVQAASLPLFLSECGNLKFDPYEGPPWRRIK